MAAFVPGLVLGFIAALFLMPEPKVVEVLPESYYRETNVQESVCTGPLQTHIVGSNIESQVFTNLSNK